MYRRVYFLTAALTGVVMGDGNLATQVAEKGRVEFGSYCNSIGVPTNDSCIRALMTDLYSNYKGGTIYLKPDTYVFDSVTLVENIRIEGFGSAIQYAQTNFSKHVVKIVTKFPTQDYIFKLSQGSVLQNLTFWGVKVSGNLVTPAAVVSGYGALVKECTFSEFQVGWDARYQGANQLIASRFYNNEVGIKNFVDAIITGNFFHSNRQHGIYLQTGASENTISNNKIEWNWQHGVSIYNAADNSISNNVIDRNGFAGIALIGCNRTLITGNQLQRNGFDMGNISTQPWPKQEGFSSHIYLENSTNTSITSNMTQYGQGDHPDSLTTRPKDALFGPYHSVYMRIPTGPSNLLLSGNNMLGCDPTKIAVDLYQIPTATQYPSAP